MHRKTQIGVLALLAVALTGVPAYSQPMKMTISTGVDPNFAVFYVAKEAGILEKHGLDVTVKTGPSGSATVPLLIGNEVQAAMGSEQAGISNFNVSNGKVVLVAEGSHLVKYYAIVSKSEIKTIEQLKGKKVGVATGTGSEGFWLQFLKVQNLKASDFTVVQVEAPEMVAAVERGNIDGYSAWEPWVSRGIIALQPKVHVLRDSQGIYSPRSFIYMNREWVEKNRDAAERFMKAMVETTDYINKNPKEAAAHAARFLKLDQVLTETLFTKLEFRMHLDKDTMEAAKLAEDQLKQIGKLTKPVDWKNYVYDGLLKKVRSENVKYTLPQ